MILSGIAFVIIYIFLKSPENVAQESFVHKLRRIDYLGTLFATGFVVCLLLGLSWGNSYGWNDGHSIGSFVASGVCFIALVYVEGWVAKEPVSYFLIHIIDAYSLFLFSFCLPKSC